MKTDVHSADVFSAFSCLTNPVKLTEKLSSPLQGGCHRPTAASCWLYTFLIQ